MFGDKADDDFDEKMCSDVAKGAMPVAAAGHDDLCVGGYVDELWRKAAVEYIKHILSKDAIFGISMYTLGWRYKYCDTWADQEFNASHKPITTKT